MLLQSALVTINVHPTCVSGWKGAEERVDYLPRAGQKPLVSTANLHICEDDKDTCTVESVEAVVELHAAHVSEGCARESLFSNETRERYCIFSFHWDFRVESSCFVYSYCLERGEDW